MNYVMGVGIIDSPVELFPLVAGGTVTVTIGK